MDWKSKRVGAILEAALAEDRVTNDITTALTIPSNLAPTPGTIIANGNPCTSSRPQLYPRVSETSSPKMSLRTPVGRFAK